MSWWLSSRLKRLRKGTSPMSAILHSPAAQAMDVVVGPDALYRAHRPGAQPRAGPIGDAQIHRHAHQGRVEARQIAILHRPSAQGRVKQRGYALVRLGPPVGAGEHLLDDLAEFRVVRLAGRRGRVARTQGVELLAVHLQALLALHLDWRARANIAASLPAPPRRHLYRYYPRNCLAFSANCTGEETVRRRPRYFPLGRILGEPRCSIAHGDGLQPTRTALLERKTARPGQAVARHQARAFACWRH